MADEKTVVFGRYARDKKGDIIWRVLAEEDGKTFLVTEKAIECMPYNEKSGKTCWRDCTLREWLNGAFFDDAFNPEEQSRIVETTFENEGEEPISDKVFLLGAEDLKKYFKDDNSKRCVPTEHAKFRGVYTAGSGDCTWWLRDAGKSADKASCVNFGGCLSNVFSASNSDFGVRPAMWITSD